MNTYIILLIVLALLAIIIWLQVQRLRCVTCGRIHFLDSEVYICDKCGKPFCRDKVSYGEQVSSTVHGMFSSVSSSASTRISFQDKCGSVLAIISNTQPKHYVYHCKRHDSN